MDSPFQSTLFIPQEDPLETLWSPAPPSLEATRTSHPSFSSIQYSDAAEGFIDSLLSSHPDAIVHTLPSEVSYHFPSLPDFLSKKTGERTEKFLLPALHKARLIKTPFEIELIRKANAISSRAHELIMRLLGKHANSYILAGADEGRLVLPGDWRIEREAEAEAAFVASCRREGYASWLSIRCHNVTDDMIPEEPCIRLICLSLQGLSVPPRFITAVAMSNSHGVRFKMDTPALILRTNTHIRVDDSHHKSCF